MIGELSVLLDDKLCESDSLLSLNIFPWPRVKNSACVWSCGISDVIFMGKFRCDADSCFQVARYLFVLDYPKEESCSAGLTDIYWIGHCSCLDFALFLGNFLSFFFLGSSSFLLSAFT